MRRTLLLLLLCGTLPAAQILLVTKTSDDGTPGTLRYAMTQAESIPNSIIDCSFLIGNTITLSSALPPIVTNTTITNGGAPLPVTLNANGNQAFFVYSGSVSIAGFTVVNGAAFGARGGDGTTDLTFSSGGGGGGGAGGGGGLLNLGSVVLSNVHFVSNSATGGAGGDAGTGTGSGTGGGGGGGAFGGGAGGAGGAEAPSGDSASGAGGGGGGFPGGGQGGSGATSTSHGQAGANGIGVGGGGGGGSMPFCAEAVFGGNGGSGGTLGGGGAGGLTSGPPSSAGGGGGGGGSGIRGGHGTYSCGLGGGGGGSGGGGGNFGLAPTTGGGGGAEGASSGHGGGGGGRSSNQGFHDAGSPGGRGGVGGGGGGGGGNFSTLAYVGGTSLFGGGTGGLGGVGTQLSGGGGGGAGMGGAIFLYPGSSLTITSGSFSGSSVVGGAGGAGGTSALNGNSGGAFGADLFLSGGSFLTFNLTSDLSVPNPIDGDTHPGSLIKTGPATLTLNGASTYLTTSGTQVQAGTLIVNGSLADAVVVQSGGTFGGNATLSGSLTNSGIVKPGNSIGTITVPSFTQTASGVFEVEVNPNGSSSLLNVTGNASLAGTLEILASAGTYNNSFTCLTAGSITGTFTNLTINQTTQNFFLNPGGLTFTIDPGTSVIVFLSGTSYPATSITKGNAASLLTGFQSVPLIAGSDAWLVDLNLLTLSPSELQTTANLLSNAQIYHQMIVAQSSAVDIMLDLSDRLMTFTSPCGQLFEAHRDVCWFSSMGGSSRQNQKGELIGFHSWQTGVTGGYGHLLLPTLAVGGATSYLFAELIPGAHTGHGRIQGYFASTFISWFGNSAPPLRDEGQEAFHDIDDPALVNWGVHLILMGAWNEFFGSRHIQFAQIDRRALHHNQGYQLSPALVMNLGINVWDGFTCLPYVNLLYSYLHQYSFSERHAKSLDLHVEDKTGRYVRSEVGASLAKCISLAKGRLLPKVGASWVYEQPLSSSRMSIYFGEFGSSSAFVVSVLNPKRQLFAPMGSLSYVVGPEDRVALDLNYTSEMGYKYFTQTAYLRFGMKF